MAFQNQQTEWRTVEQLDQIKTSQKGNPQRGVRTEKGWVKVAGEFAKLDSLLVGHNIELQGLREWTPPNGGKPQWFANLVSFSTRTESAPKPEQETQAPVSQNGNNHGNGKVSWSDYMLVAKAAHGLAREIEPDDHILFDREGGPHEIKLDRSQARAAIVNTCLIAFTNGKLEVPELDPWAEGPDAN